MSAPHEIEANTGKMCQGLWYWSRAVRAKLGESGPYAMNIGLGRIYAHHEQKPYAIFCGSTAFHNLSMPDSIAPSGRWNRSLTKTVLRIRKVLTGIIFLTRLTFGALSLGSCCPQASVRFLVDGRILSHRAPYFCGPEQISGLSSVSPFSASSSAVRLGDTQNDF
jgi:hypothetical protein